MGMSSVELFKIQADIGNHRHRVARLLEDVDVLRRSVAECGVATLTGRTGAMLDLCTSANSCGRRGIGRSRSSF